MKEKRWYNIAVYVPEETIPFFLVQCIWPKVADLYNKAVDEHWFFYIDDSRGDCISIFMQYSTHEENAVIAVYYAFLEDVNAWVKSDGQRSIDQVNRTTIFKDLPSGCIPFNLFRLKVTPFIEFPKFSESYFSVLSAVSSYLLQQTTGNMAVIFQNKFVFCFSLFFESVYRLAMIDNAFSHEYNQFVESEIRSAGIATGKDLRKGLLDTYEKNKDILQGYAKLQSVANPLSFLFNTEAFGDLLEIMLGKLNQCADDFPRSSIVQSLFADLSAMLNVKNHITCLFFVKCQLNKTFQSNIQVT